MKAFRSLVPLILSAFLAGCPGKRAEHIPESAVSFERNGVAVLLTGAAARIPQEAALLEELDKRGLLEDLVFISGVSSGALNSVMLNGI
jgi:predicted acylesterase/phospholipase RssA